VLTVLRPLEIKVVSATLLHTVTEDVAGGFANLRSAWRHFLVNCGILADRFLAYTYAEITFLRISAIFRQISKIMVPLKSANFSASDGLYKTNFWNRKLFGVWWSPLRFRYLWVAYPKRHIYDISANNPCFLRANLMFYVGCSRKTQLKHPPQNPKKHNFFDPPSPTRKTNPEFLTMGINYFCAMLCMCVLVVQ